MNNQIDYDDLDSVVLTSNMEYNFSMEKDPFLKEAFLTLLKKVKYH